MTARILLRVIIATWLLLIPLPWCIDSLGAMLVWLFALAFYAVAIVIPAVIQAEHIDERMLPAERGLPEPKTYPPMPKVTPPFRFVGASDRAGDARTWTGAAYIPRDLKIYTTHQQGGE